MDIFSNSGVDPQNRMLFIVGLFLPVLLMALAIVWRDRGRARRVRRFRCRGAEREVEVTFVANEVRACSAFEPSGAITCRRACRGAAYRRQWEPALPVLSRKGLEASP